MMKNRSLVSIVVPIYNGEKWLNKAVDSAINQSYKNIEILLIDDGSTDNSLDLCNSFKQDRRVRVFHKSNGGQASARNLGLKVCKGEFVQFLDCDDSLSLTAVETAMGYMYEDVDFVLFGFNVYSRGVLLRTPHVERMSYRGEFELFQKWSYLMASPCNKLYRKSYIKNLFQEDCVYGEDGIFNYTNFSSSSRIECIDNCLYNVNLDNPQSVNKRYKKGRLADTVFSIQTRLSKISSLFGKDKIQEKGYLADSIATLCYTIRLVAKNSTYRQFSEELSVSLYKNKPFKKWINMKMVGVKKHNKIIVVLLKNHSRKLLYLFAKLLSLLS